VKVSKKHLTSGKVIGFKVASISFSAIENSWFPAEASILHFRGGKNNVSLNNDRWFFLDH